MRSWSYNSNDRCLEASFYIRVLEISVASCAKIVYSLLINLSSWALFRLYIQ